MHDYSIDKHPKDKIFFFIAFIAILITPKLNSLVEYLADLVGKSFGWTTIPLAAIPAIALFGILYWSLNKHLWKVSFFRRLFLVPDINGEWEIKGMTTLKEGKPENFKWDGKIIITQSWSRILIHLQTDKSVSKSVSGSIHYVNGVGYRLLYQYENVPDADQHELGIHTGSAELLFNKDCDNASGHYFTDQHRNTVGTMNLTKAENVE